MELIVTKVAVTTTTKDVSFVQTDPKNTVTLPVDELMIQTLDFNRNAEHVCI